MAARRGDVHPSRKRPMTEGGIRFDLRVLHRVFGYAAECGYISANPVRVRGRNATAGKTRPFTQEEIAATLAAAETSPQLRAVVLTFLHTGLRIGDVIALRKADVAGRELRVQTRKRDRAVSLHVHPDLRAALDAHLAAQNPAQRASEYLFSSTVGQPLAGLDKRLRRLWQRAGIAGGHAHRFRATFAVRLLEHGASLYDVAKLLGNSVAVVEAHYSPYVRELQERGARLVSSLDFVKEESCERPSTPE